MGYLDLVGSSMRTSEIFQKPVIVHDLYTQNDQGVFDMTLEASLENVA